MKVSLSETENKVKFLTKVVDKCSIDLTHFMIGLNDDILPSLLSDLTANGSEEIKHMVFKQISGGEGTAGVYRIGKKGVQFKE